MCKTASSEEARRSGRTGNTKLSTGVVTLVVLAFAQTAILQMALCAETDQAAAWEAADQLGGEAQDWAQMLRSTPAAAKPLSPEAFKGWFAPLEEKKSKVWQDDKAAVARFSGLWKLRAPWPDDAVLRLCVAPGSRLRIHLWNNASGVSLLYDDHHKAPHRWFAYEATRQEGAFRPDTYASACDDGGRYARVQPPVRKGQTPIILPTDIRYQDGKIVVSCADVPLLTVPLAGKPQAVCIEEAGSAAGTSGPALLAVGMARAKAPLDASPAIKMTLDLSPASLEWKVEPAAELVKMGDGRVWLSHPRYNHPSWAATPVPKGSIREFVFEFEGAQPGSGVYLGDGDGAVLAAIRVSAPSADGPRVVRVEPRIEQAVRPYNHDTNSSPVPWVSGIIRLRILVAGGTMKAWVGTAKSGWTALWPEAAADFGGKTIATVGVFCAVRDKSWDSPPRGITLRRIQAREYPAINSLAGEDLIRRAPDLHSAAPSEWLAKASAAKPGGADQGAWLRACAIRSIADGAPRPLCVALVDALAADAMQGPGSPQDKIELLVRLAAIAPSAPAEGGKPEEQTARWDRLESRYDRVARLAIEQDGQDAARLHTRVFDLTPPPGRTVETLLQRLARRQLVRCASKSRWDTLDDLSKRLGAYHRPGLDEVIRWCEAQSPRHPQGGEASRRHPFQLTDSRDERSFKIEFSSAVANGHVDRACRLFISRYVDAATLGLVRNPADGRGWIRLQTSAALLARSYPQVQQRLIDEYSLRGKLRVRQAITDKDAARVEVAASQFYGTPAAAEAHVWLGDQAYLAGRFDQAAEHYAMAAESADVITRGQAAIKHRLASAHLGRKVGQPATASITIGETSWPAEKIEQEVARALQAAGSAKPVAAEATLPWVLPKPAGFAATIVNNAGQMPPRPAPVPPMLWTPQQVGRLISAVPRAGQFAGGVFCERAANILKCTRADGQSWQTEIPAILMVAEWHRRGKTKWKEADFKDQPRRPFMVSQPAIVGDRVYALFEEQTRDGAKVTLHGFELAGGKRIVDQQLFLLVQFTGGKRDMLLKIAGDRYLIWYERGALCGRIGGEVMWARLPESPALWSAGREANPPGGADPLVLDGDRVYLADGATPYVECVDLALGTLHWVSPPLEAGRLVGRVGDRVIVETADELVALDAADGRVVWRRPAEHLPNALGADEAGGVLYARPAVAGTKAARQVELVWVDPKNGQTRAMAMLNNLFGPNVPAARFGPFIGLGGELVALAQSGQSESKVQVVRLTPSGAAQAANPGAERHRLWQNCLSAAGP